MRKPVDVLYRLSDYVAAPIMSPRQAEAPLWRGRSLPPGCLPRCLRRAAAAEYVGVGVTLFDAMVEDGRMPKPIRINARTLWDRLQLDEAVTLLRDEGEAALDSWADFGS